MREEVQVKKRKYRRSARRESREGVRVEKDRVEQKCKWRRNASREGVREEKKCE